MQSAVVGVVAEVGAQPSADTVRRVASSAALVATLGVAHGPSIWPGYRPDTIPLAFVLPVRGTLLFGWRGALPDGYVALDAFPNAGWRDVTARGAASTSIEIAGRRVAQMVMSSLESVELVPLAFHEAFHVFLNVQRRPGRRFGAGENSALIGTYPVFDVQNEAAFVLEGRVLAASYRISTLAQKRALAQQFVSIRRSRHRALPHALSAFDQDAELNEGLAEYALTRALDLMATVGPPESRTRAQQIRNDRIPALERLTSNDPNSLRLRFYQTGPAIARLLDALSDSSWKVRLMKEDLTLQDLLASVSGVDAVAEDALAQAQRTFGATQARVDAEGAIERLQTVRRAQVESALALPGLKVVLLSDSLPSRSFNQCGFDPQNLLQVTSTLTLHTRWWKACSGGPTYADLTGRSVYDAQRGTVTAVVGAESEVVMTGDGAPILVPPGQRLANVRTFKLVTPRAVIDCARADVWREGSTLYILAKPP